MKSSIILITILFAFYVPSPTWSQCNTTPEQKLLASNGAPNDSMGYSVAISGDWAIIGAKTDSTRASNSGAAYIFHFNGSTWVQMQKLFASDGITSELFGSSVSIDGNTAVVGARMGHNTSGIQSGAAYVYRFNGSSWIQEQKLQPLDGIAQQRFGYAVGVSNGTIIVGAYEDTIAGWTSAGSAYVFRWNGSSWTQEQKLLASDGTGGDFFGFSVAISDGVAVIGAYGDDDLGNVSGAAYVFRYHSEGSAGYRWVQEQRLSAADGEGYDNFGYAVAVSGNLIVVGSHKDDDNGINFGSAYVFRWNGTTWVQETELYGSDSGSNDMFGASVAVSRPISGDMVIVGAPKWPSGSYVGATYVFRKSGPTWRQETILRALQGASNDQFGISVSASDNRAMVGEFAYAGKAFVYTINCSVAATISSSSPPNNFVDALEDRDASSGALLGLQSISLTFSAPVTSAGGSALAPANFQVRCVRNGAAASDLQTGLVPSVTQVSGSGAGPYTLQLSQRLCLGAWTEIKAVNVVSSASGTPISAAGYDNRVVLGNLPVDITQDGRVLGDDISRWLAINNNAFDPAPLTKLLLLDQKRNGVVAGEDITRGIQLINGIGTFRVWNGFDMGAKP